MAFDEMTKQINSCSFPAKCIDFQCVFFISPFRLPLGLPFSLAEHFACVWGARRIG